MSIAERYFMNYVMGACSYGLLRKMDDAAYAKVMVREWNEEVRTHYDRQVPMLFVDRLMVVGISTLAAPLLLPKYLYDDLSALEIYLRHVDPKDYDRKVRRTVLDHLF